VKLFNEGKEEPKPRGHFRRYRQIAMVLAKYRLEEVLKYVGLERYLIFRWLLRGNPWRKLPYSKPERMRMAIEELGTFFVKLGQVLSTRTDLLPLSYTKELSKLQDALQPLPVEDMKNVITGQFGRPIEELFSHFDDHSIGVASIGQVYDCTLANGTKVVVKVQKPGVPQLIEEDMYILRRAAAAATKSWKGSEQYDLVGVAQELSDTIKMETEYIQEAHNAEYFTRFFQKDRSVHVPKIIWEYTTDKVLTMERIEGIRILDIESLQKAGFDLKDLAVRCVNLWLKMIFEGEIYHADPHPGNLFVEKDGRLALIDSGMVGFIDDEVRWNLVNMLKGIFDSDADLLIDSLIELGAVNLRDHECRTCLRKDIKYYMVHYPMTHLMRPSEGVNFGLEQLFTLLRRNHIQIPSTTFQMLKTVVMAQSLGTALDPDFDMFPLLEGYLKHIVHKRYSIFAAIRKLPSDTAQMASLAGGLPQRLNRLMKSVERGDLRVSADVGGVEKHVHHLEGLVNRAVIGIIVMAVILGLALVFVGLKLP
jgi:ubiquinone biosynthesis protein